VDENSRLGKKILETERLSLREMTTADAPVLVEILNEPAFIEFVADRGVRTVADAEKFIEEKFLASYAQHGFGFYMVELKGSGEPIGMCGLIKRETLEDVDIGFSIFERFWGKGYATEAARALMQHGLTRLGLPRIVGVTAPHNERSAAVLEKLGLRFEKMIELSGYTHPATRLFSHGGS
jgi:RimJ/RimL family protein N-acetyltransferase